MTLYVKVSDDWKVIYQPYVKISDNWKEVKQVFVKVSGDWKEIFDSYTYSWVVGDWSECSVSCGGGTQTRSVVCQREDSVIVSDSKCTTTKPNLSQACNTKDCDECRGILYTDYWQLTDSNCTHRGDTGIRIRWNNIVEYYSGSCFHNGLGLTEITYNGIQYTRNTHLGNAYYIVCRHVI